MREQASITWPLQATRELHVQLIESYFANHPRCTLGQRHATYENPETGVTLSWSWQTEPFLLSLSVRIGCADFFLLEALRELEAICQVLPLRPESDHFGALSARWSLENRAVIASLMRDLPITRGIGCSPRAKSRAVWQWNSVRAVYADRLAMVDSLPCAVPGVYWLAARSSYPYAQTLLTCVDWVDLEPIALPEVDLVCWSDLTSGRGGLAPLVALSPWMPPPLPAEHRFGRMGKSFQMGLAHRIIDGLSEESSARVRETLVSSSTARRFERVSAEDVLDCEDVYLPARTTADPRPSVPPAS